MTTVTIDVAEGKESQCKNFMTAILENYGYDELEDILLGLHIENNRKENDFVSEEEVFKCLNES